ncbi:hypothetical protein BO71DRAFT_393741 [Aspergillus ellipticus CBS 707.79]|uniref:Uncharacterized protein n=1 Tax=Aspergillus ellipticus CBS 707.79 TaxID=1448320 RepID=A0A319DRB2_9EURO|nr:hypothetical protein BO71DRAFT_393741 [Aspergillus ellipticus CBS 707.79]
MIPRLKPLYSKQADGHLVDQFSTILEPRQTDRQTDRKTDRQKDRHPQPESQSAHSSRLIK